MNTLRWTLRAVATALPVALLICVCPAVAGDAPSLRVKGANSMATLVDDLAGKFRDAGGGEPVSVFGGGTTAGFEAMTENGADLVMASRRVRIKELQSAALAGANPAKCFSTVIALAFVTRPDNPVDALTMEQFSRIFTGEVTRWSQVGGPDEEIIAFAGKPTTGTAVFLRKELLNAGFFGANVKVREYFNDIVRAVAGKHRLSIGYADYERARRSEEKGLVKILAVKRNAESQGILPSTVTLKDGSYPLALPLYLYWDENRVSPKVKKFVGFVSHQLRDGHYSRKD